MSKFIDVLEPNDVLYTTNVRGSTTRAFRITDTGDVEEIEHSLLQADATGTTKKAEVEQ